MSGKVVKQKYFKTLFFSSHGEGMQETRGKLEQKYSGKALNGQEN